MWLSLVLVVSCCATAHAGYWMTKGKSADIQDNEGDEGVRWDGKEVGRYQWKVRGGTHEYHVKIAHGDGDTEWKSQWTITGLPGKILRPGEKVRIVATGTASGKCSKWDLNDTSSGVHVTQSGLIGAKSARASVGFLGSLQITPNAEIVVEGTVPDGAAKYLGIVASISGALTNRQELYYAHGYEWVEGEAPIQPETPAKPEEPAKPEPGDPTTRPPLQMQMELVTQKYQPGEPITGLLIVTTGLKPGESVDGTLRFAVCKDTTADELLWMMARGGQGQAALPKVAPSAVEVTSKEEPVRLNQAVEAIPLTRVSLRAPDQDGDYVVTARLTLKDGRSAVQSLPIYLAVGAAMRRLLVSAVETSDVPAGSPCAVKLIFRFGDVSAPNAPKSQGKVSGTVQSMNSGAAGFSQDLPEQVPPLKPLEEGKSLDGHAVWSVVFPRPGMYRISVQVAVPYYGARERTAVVTVSDGGTVAGGYENIVAGAAAGAMGGDGATTTGGATTTATTGGGPGTGGNDVTGVIPGGGNAGGGTTTVGTQTGGGQAGGGQAGGAGDAPPTLIPSVGLTLSLEHGVLTVVGATGDAVAAGVVAGYTLVEIDGKPTQGMSLEQAKQRLTPQGGKELMLLTFADADGNRISLPVTAKRR